MASGLIHYRRNCDFCNSEMSMKHSLYEPKYNYFWVCNLCFREKHINVGSPCSGLNIRAFDKAIILWIERATATITQKLSGNIGTGPYYRLIRYALSSYIEVRVKPYFKISG